MANIETHTDNRISGAFGEFEDYGIPMTDEEWASHDEALAEEIARWDEENPDDYVDLDPEPPF